MEEDFCVDSVFQVNFECKAYNWADRLLQVPKLRLNQKFVVVVAAAVEGVEDGDGDDVGSVVACGEMNRVEMERVAFDREGTAVGKGIHLAGTVLAGTVLAGTALVETVLVEIL